ncbi:hypothetical protein M885DRAFT_584285 [Pelagophyceae sp. CCMP2097]|nr:hypothetical protein M885DRAFT_584285 [Pelagophyceae sp. CCMP2097]
MLRCSSPAKGVDACGSKHASSSSQHLTTAIVGFRNKSDSSDRFETEIVGRKQTRRLLQEYRSNCYKERSAKAKKAHDGLFMLTFFHGSKPDRNAKIAEHARDEAQWAALQGPCAATRRRRDDAARRREANRSTAVPRTEAAAFRIAKPPKVYGPELKQQAAKDSAALWRVDSDEPAASKRDDSRHRWDQRPLRPQPRLDAYAAVLAKAEADWARAKAPEASRPASAARPAAAARSRAAQSETRAAQWAFSNKKGPDSFMLDCASARSEKAFELRLVEAAEAARLGVSGPQAWRRATPPMACARSAKSTRRSTVVAAKKNGARSQSAPATGRSPVQ